MNAENMPVEIVANSLFMTGIINQLISSLADYNKKILILIIYHVNASSLMFVFL